MRNYHAYKWNDVLEEEVPRTMIGLKCITQEKEEERKQYDKINRKTPKR